MSDETTIDDYHYHEIMDRVHLLRGMMEDFLYDHPAMEPEWKDWLHEADKFLGKIYQDCGATRRD